jgi:hypothetical protein
MLQCREVIDAEYDIGTEASHHVIHQDGDRITFQALPQQWATFHVGKVLLERAERSGVSAQLLKRLVSSSNPDEGSRGAFFEAQMHSAVPNGQASFK